MDQSVPLRAILSGTDAWLMTCGAEGGFASRKSERETPGKVCTIHDDRSQRDVGTLGSVTHSSTARNSSETPASFSSH